MRSKFHVGGVATSSHHAIKGINTSPSALILTVKQLQTKHHYQQQRQLVGV